REVVTALTFDPFCRERRWALEKRAAECVERRVDRGASRQRALMPRADRLAFGIRRVRPLTECDCRLVRLVARAHEPRQPCGAAEDERQHAGGHRIERPRVADGALLQRSTHTDDDVMRRRPFRLVDDDEAVHYPPESIAASIRSMNIF